MTREIPYMPLYVERFDVDTSHLTFEEDGAYNRLLRLGWRQSGCSLPDDRCWLIRNLRTDPETFDRVVEPVIAEFFRRANGRITQKRQREEFSKAIKLQRARREGGLKGVAAKRLKNGDKDVSKAEAKDKPTSTSPQPFREGKVREGKEERDLRHQSDPMTARAIDDDDDFHSRILASAGMARPDNGQAKAQRSHSRRWIDDLGLDEGEAIAVVQSVVARSRNGPPASLAYFDREMAVAAGRKQAHLEPISPPATKDAEDARLASWGIYAIPDDVEPPPAAYRSKDAAAEAAPLPDNFFADEEVSDAKPVGPGPGSGDQHPEEGSGAADLSGMQPHAEGEAPDNPLPVGDDDKRRNRGALPPLRSFGGGKA